MPPGGHAADEDAGIAGIVLDARAVAEQRASAAAAAGSTAKTPTL
jgi:hypothetical protein